VIGRIVGDVLSRAMGQSFVVEAKPGAAGNIAGEYVASQPPDGYTLYLAAWSALIVNKVLYKDLPYDPDSALAPISIVANNQLPLTVTTQLPAATFAAFVAYAKANPGKLNHGSPGIGSQPHLADELLKQRLGFQSEHVPYRGSAPFSQALARGEVQWGFDAANTALAGLKGGTIRILAITGMQRDSMLPDTPTLEELGVPDSNWAGYFSLVGPAALPKDIVATLYGELARGLKDPEVVQRLRNLGLHALAMPPEESARVFARDRAIWAKIVRDNNIKAE
jgi:tripartite-type tricarboxylate transporter receptor subunit TctC